MQPKTLDPTMIQAHSASEAEAIVREMHPAPAVVAAYEATGSPESNYYDVLVWANEADSINDDGAKAVARYRIHAA